MQSVVPLAAAVLGILVVERLVVLRVTADPCCRAWLRGHRLFHPNVISLFRLPMGLLTVAAWLAGWHRAALLWFAFWMVTDLSDGTIARRCGLDTDAGKWLDPLSDKCMYVPPLTMLAALGVLAPGWVAALVLFDVAGQGARFVVRRTAANRFGKAKTALITVLLGLAGLDQIEPLPFVDKPMLQLLTAAAAVLAFLSLCGKLLPGNMTRVKT